MTRQLLLLWLGVLLRNELGQSILVVKECTADTSGWLRHGSFLRNKTECQQGYVCDGTEIKPLSKLCVEPKYMSVFYGGCTWSNYYVGTSFNCSTEANDPNLDYDKVVEKRNRTCQLMMRQSDPGNNVLYAIDPYNCRRMYNCSKSAVFDVWRYLCGPGMRAVPFNDERTQGFCVWDAWNCGAQSK